MIDDFAKSSKIHKKFNIISMVSFIILYVFYLISNLGEFGPFKNVSFYPFALSLSGIYIVLLVIVQIYATNIANKEMKAILDVIYVDCDPYEYIKIYYPIATKLAKDHYDNLRKYNNLCVGYIDSGQWDTGIQMLQSIQIIPTKKHEKVLQFICFNNLCYCYLHKNDLEAAQFYISQMQSLINEFKQGQPKLTRKLENYVNSKINFLHILQGEYVESRTFFEDQFKIAENRYIQIVSAYMLALIYNKTGEEQKKQEAINFIKKYGNKLIYVKLVETL